MATQHLKYEIEESSIQDTQRSPGKRASITEWLMLAIFLAPFVYLFWMEAVAPITITGHIELELALIILLYIGLFIWLSLGLD